MGHTWCMLHNLALSRGDLDRLAHRRSDQAWFAAACADPETFVIGVSGSEIAVDGDALRSLRDRAVEPERAALIGSVQGRLHVALMVEHPDDLEGSMSLRDVGVRLSDDEAAVATTAVALHQWHRTHTHCARCGAATRNAMAGWERHCVVDASAHYPRTDPAVIVVITDRDERLLLARQRVWAEHRFSLVAGYVEPGESAEQAVAREVLEEVGLRVREPRFLGSQPWPFPASLMLCYAVDAAHTDFCVDGEEISEAKWFSRSQLHAAVTDGSLLLPSGVSIARRAIEDWFGSALPE